MNNLICGLIAISTLPVVAGLYGNKNSNTNIDLSKYCNATRLKESGSEKNPYSVWGDFRPPYSKHKTCSACKNGCKRCARSYGAYQIQKARWNEGCTSKAQKDLWGKAPQEVQDQVMMNLAKQYYNKARNENIKNHSSIIKYMARCHNGWGKASVSYASDILRLYRNI